MGGWRSHHVTPPSVLLLSSSGSGHHQRLAVARMVRGLAGALVGTGYSQAVSSWVAGSKLFTCFEPIVPPDMAGWLQGGASYQPASHCMQRIAADA